jgi:hypothetical protein
VWLHVHRKRRSYNPQKHPTQRAWLAAFVDRCVKNDRRTQRRQSLTPMEDPEAYAAASGLSPEGAALLGDLHRLIPDEDQRVAFLLQKLHGFSIEEIAAAQGVTDSAVERRLKMARNALEGDENKKKRSGAYLGFGSLEALVEALRPKEPIPDEVGQEMWEQISERIRQEEASQGNGEDAPESGEDFPPLDAEPPLDPSAALAAAPALPALTSPALPALTSPALPALVAIGKGKLGTLLVLACVIGPGAGVGTALAWQAHNTSARHGCPTLAMDAATAASATTAPSSTAAAPSTSSRPAASTAPAGPPTAPSSTAAAPSTSSRPAASTAPSGAATPDEGESRRLLARMRDSMIARQYSAVLTLAEQHAQRFGASHVRDREALRIEALRQTGRTKDAEQHARAVITTHPEHKRAMERAAGRALP